MTNFLIITGLSGAGRSTAADTFEDTGWFVIDNLPPALIPKVVDLAQAPGSSIDRVVLVVGTGAYIDEVGPALDRLRATSGRVRHLFLEASTDAIVRRYEATRRRHPLAESDRVSESIEREREVLEPVKAMADVVLDTTELNLHQLRERLIELFAHDDPAARLQTSVVSFGYKHGLPLDVDMVFDCRFLSNPHWIEELRPYTGLDHPVREYVLSQPQTHEFLARLDEFFAFLLPAYAKEGKSYLSIAVGCTGGRHRAVVVAEALAQLLAKRGFQPIVHHRDIDR